MRIALKCEECGVISMQEEDEVCIEFDFRERRIFYICKYCKHENIFDLADWKKQQKHSPLPPTRIC